MSVSAIMFCWLLQARPLLIQVLESGDLRELLDPRLGNRYVESEVINMIEIAAVCICHSAPKRPRMVQVLKANGYLNCCKHVRSHTNVYP